MRAELIGFTRRVTCVGLAIGATLLLLPGCAPEHAEPYLRWEGRPAASAPVGHVAIRAVANMRPAKRGDQDLNAIGNIREGSHTPQPIRLDSQAEAEPQALDVALTAFVKDALGAADIGTANANDPSATARLVIEIHDLWVDGAGSLADEYTANVSLALVVEDPVTGQIRVTVPVRGEGKATPGRHTRHVAFVKLACRRALDQAYASLVDALAQPSLREALTTAPPPQASAAPATKERSPATKCPSDGMTEDAAGHCCWPGQLWANDKCNGRPTKCPSGQSVRGDRCVGTP